MGNIECSLIDYNTHNTRDYNCCCCTLNLVIAKLLPNALCLIMHGMYILIAVSCGRISWLRVVASYSYGSIKNLSGYLKL